MNSRPNAPDRSFSANSLRASYRWKHLFWIFCSVVYSIVYLFVADVPSDRTHALFLAATLLMPAIFFPLYIWRATFATQKEAMIRSLAPGIAFSGIPAALHQLSVRFHPFADAYGHGRLQVVYISIVLLAIGLASGVEFGILRWEFLQSAAATQTSAKSRAMWRRYIQCATLWVASAMGCAWLAVLFPSVHIETALATAGLLAIPPGVLLVAPAAVLFPAEASPTLRKRIWKYWSKCLWIGFAVFLFFFTVASVLARSPLIIIYLISVAIYFLPAFWLVCLLWAFLTASAEQPNAPGPEAIQAVIQSGAPSPASFAKEAQRRTPATWQLLLLGLAVQPCILVPALWTTSPAPLGFSGIGCVTASYTYPSEYWFWKAYKGIASQSSFSGGTIYRLSANPHVCGVVASKDSPLLYDPQQITIGYANAARAWIWLIDPDEWESLRAKEIRKNLTLLLGREFSSYSELQDWWDANNRHLVWTGTDELLEVHQTTIEEMAHRYYTVTFRSPVETIRDSPNQPFVQPAAENLDNQHDKSLTFFDREERLRGLKLAAANQIAVLSGQREREARAFLQRVSAENFATKQEWEHFFAGNPPAPWNMSRESALSWIGLIQLYGHTEPYHARYITSLREATGLNYSEPEDFIPWLQNPDNTRQEEWLKGRDLVGDLPGTNPMASLDQAMSVLRLITDQAFHSSDSWLNWWQDYRSALRLSADGRKLTSAR